MANTEKERIKFADPLQTLLENANKISGSFDLLASLSPDAKQLDPKRNLAERNVFKNDNKYKERREDLKDVLSTTLNIIEGYDTTKEMIEEAQDSISQSEDLYNENLLKVLAAIAELEKNYRSIDLFFQNSGEEEIDNVIFFNATIKELCTNEEFAKALTVELRQYFDRLNLKNAYSNLVVPGYVGEKAYLEKLAKIAYDYRMMLITDYKDVETYEELLREAATDNFQGIGLELANVIMVCNWLILRKANIDIGEMRPLYGPSSLAVAGKMYKELISQVAAGVKHGKIHGAFGAHIEKYFSETQQIEQLGLVPLLFEDNELIAWSARTLHKSADKGKMTYSVVRVFDWIAKVLMTYLNQEVFANIKPFVIKGIEEQLAGFFNSLVANDIIKEYKKPTIHHDGQGKITIDIKIEPFYPGRTFVVNITRNSNELAKSKITQE